MVNFWAIKQHKECMALDGKFLGDKPTQRVALDGKFLGNKATQRVALDGKFLGDKATQRVALDDTFLGGKPRWLETSLRHACSNLYSRDST